MGAPAAGDTTISDRSGTAPTPTATTHRNSPVPVSDLTSGVQAISAGTEHTCALTTSGGVYCWGSNHAGQLGDATTKNRLTPTAVVGLQSGVQAISAGNAHTCALTVGGNVKCWGNNMQGQLGNGANTIQTMPVTVLGLANATRLDAGESHTCAATSDGAAYCWGYNALGQLGDGTTSSSNVPVRARLSEFIYSGSFERWAF